MSKRFDITAHGLTSQEMSEFVSLVVTGKDETVSNLQWRQEKGPGQNYQVKASFTEEGTNGPAWKFISDLLVKL